LRLRNLRETNDHHHNEGVIPDRRFPVRLYLFTFVQHNYVIYVQFICILLKDMYI